MSKRRSVVPTGAGYSPDWWTISGRRRERFAGRGAEAPMQFGLILLLVEVALIVHAAKTGRFLPWGLIIFFIPGFGAIAYVLVELVPEWFGSVQGQQARRRVVNTLDPGKRYRVLSDQLEVTDTIANR